MIDSCSMVLNTIKSLFAINKVGFLKRKLWGVAWLLVNKGRQVCLTFQCSRVLCLSSHSRAPGHPVTHLAGGLAGSVPWAPPHLCAAPARAATSAPTSPWTSSQCCPRSMSRKSRCPDSKAVRRKMPSYLGETDSADLNVNLIESLLQKTPR